MSNRSGLAVALSSHLGQLVCLSRAGGPEITEALLTAVVRGVAAQLRGHVNRTDHDRLLSSAEPGLEGSLGVPALILGTFINALHAVSAAVLVITSVPETLSEFDSLVTCVLSKFVGGGAWCTHNP